MEIEGHEILLKIQIMHDVAIGITHSVLGERYILTRLFRRDNLPKLFGSTDFTTRTLRFAWHLTTVAWWGFAAILILLAKDMFSLKNISMVIAVTFIVSSIISLVTAKGKHYSWLVFLFIGGVSLYAAVISE